MPKRTRITLLALVSVLAAAGPASAAWAAKDVPRNATTVLVVDHASDATQLGGETLAQSLCLNAVLQRLLLGSTSLSQQTGTLELWGELGPSIQSLLRHTEGTVMAFTIERSGSPDQASAHSSQDFGIVIQLGSDSNAHSLLSDKLRVGATQGPQKHTTHTERYRETEIFLVSGPQSDSGPLDLGGWGIWRGHFVGAGSRRTLKSTIDRLSGADGGLNQQLSTIQKAMDLAGPGDVVLAIDPRHRKGRSMFDALIDPALTLTGSLGGVSPQIAAQTFDQIDAMFARIDIEGGLVATDLGMTFQHIPPLLGVLGLGKTQVPPETAFPPAAQRFGSARVDFVSAWQSLEATIMSLFPMLLPMAGAQLNAMLEQSGLELDLKRDVLDNLGDEVKFMHLQSPLATEGSVPIVQIPLENADSFSRAIDVIRQLVAPDPRLVEVSEQQGGRSWTLHLEVLDSADVSQEERSPITLSVVGGSLLVHRGRANMVDELRSQLAAPRSRRMNQWQGCAANLRHLPSGFHAMWFEQHGTLAPSIAFALDRMLGSESGCPSVSRSNIVQRVGPLTTAIYQETHSLIIRSRLADPSR